VEDGNIVSAHIVKLTADVAEANEIRQSDLRKISTLLRAVKRLTNKRAAMPDCVHAMGNWILKHTEDYPKELKDVLEYYGGLNEQAT